MLRGALILLVVATFIGAMMPSGPDRIDREAEETRAPPVPVEEEQSEEEEPTTDDGATASSYGSIRIEREADGHFYADVEINGQPVHFVIDTGASGIALTQDDARRAGIYFAANEFTVVGRGASGDVRGANVAIDRARLGHKSVEDIGGVVMEGGGQSLLGQNFLSRFDSVEIRGDTMTLR